MQLEFDTTKHPAIAKQLEKAFAIAGSKFPYWRVELAALQPAIVEVDPGDPRFAGFSFAVTDRLVLLISSDVMRFRWTENAWATVLLHELMHIWQRHPARLKAGGYDPHRWNIWADMEINDDLREAGCEFPKDPDTNSIMGVFPEDMGFPPYLTAEEYGELEAKENEKRLKNKGDPLAEGPMLAGGCGSGSGVENDVEAILREAGLMPSEGGDEAVSESTAKSMDAAALGRPDSEVQAIANRMDASLTAASEGPNANNISRGLALHAQALKRKSEIRWQDHLKTAIRTAMQFARNGRYTDWTRPSRRQYGVFLQPASREPKVKVMIALDTSGSMVNLLAAAVSEIESLVVAARAEVQWVQADAAIVAEGKFRGAGDVQHLRLRGMGGTDFCPVFDRAVAMSPAKRPDVLVYITDGYGDAPRNPPPFKTIWAMLGGTKPPATWGDKVLIKQGAP